MNPIDAVFQWKDEEISRFAQAQGFVVDTPEQLEFMRASGSVDLQAAPGSGKTTLIALKLAMIASAWDSALQGIVVLSHTNAAADEIRRQLKRSANGRRLLSYPHYVGTIHSFASTFFVAPSLRSAGIRNGGMDDAAYETAVIRQLGMRYRYPQLVAVLGKRYRGEQIAVKAQLSFDGSSVALAGVGLPFGLGTKSGQQLSELKLSLYRDGYLRFEDAFPLAQSYLDANPQLLAAIRWRFPFSLIDEMQDTGPEQAKLLHLIFGNRECVHQRVGDVNQRIYSTVSGSDGCDTIPDLVGTGASEELSIRTIHSGDS